MIHHWGSKRCLEIRWNTVSRVRYITSRIEVKQQLILYRNMKSSGNKLWELVDYKTYTSEKTYRKYNHYQVSRSLVSWKILFSQLHKLLGKRIPSSPNTSRVVEPMTFQPSIGRSTTELHRGLESLVLCCWKEDKKQQLKKIRELVCLGRTKRKSVFSSQFQQHQQNQQQKITSSILLNNFTSCRRGGIAYSCFWW